MHSFSATEPKWAFCLVYKKLMYSRLAQVLMQLNLALRSFPAYRSKVINRWANKNLENNILWNQKILYFQAFFLKNTLLSLAIYTNVTIFSVHFLELYMGRKLKTDKRDKTGFYIRKPKLHFLTSTEYIPIYS